MTHDSPCGYIIPLPRLTIGVQIKIYAYVLTACTQKVETPQIGKQHVIYSYNEILLSYKKEWTTNPRMGEPWKHPEWKKPDTKGHILCDFIDMGYSEQANLLRQSRLVAPSIWGKSRMGMGFPFSLMKKFWSKMRVMLHSIVDGLNATS